MTCLSVRYDCLLGPAPNSATRLLTYTHIFPLAFNTARYLSLITLIIEWIAPLASDEAHEAWVMHVFRQNVVLEEDVYFNLVDGWGGATTVLPNYFLSFTPVVLFWYCLLQPTITVHRPLIVLSASFTLLLLCSYIITISWYLCATSSYALWYFNCLPSVILFILGN